MKFWSVTAPSPNNLIRGLASTGLILLATLSASYAAEPDSPAATKPQGAAAPKPALPTPAAKPALPAPAAKIKPKPQETAECIRIGQRVIAALAREDTGAASQFFNFYSAFKCSQTHLEQAFGCLASLQEANPGLSNPTQEQVTQCWKDPTVTPKVQPPQPTEAPH